MSLIVWLTLRDMITIHREWVFVIIPAIVLFAGTVQYLVGYFMDRYKIIDDLQKWDLERSPLITKILKQTEVENEQNNNKN